MTARQAHLFHLTIQHGELSWVIHFFGHAETHKHSGRWRGDRLPPLSHWGAPRCSPRRARVRDSRWKKARGPVWIFDHGPQAGQSGISSFARYSQVSTLTPFTRKQPPGSRKRQSCSVSGVDAKAQHQEVYDLDSSAWNASNDWSVLAPASLLHESRRMKLWRQAARLWRVKICSLAVERGAWS